MPRGSKGEGDVTTEEPERWGPPDNGVGSDTPPRNSRRERTKAALLEAGRAVFEEDGFFEARISDIAKRAGVSHGTFYTHFKSKDEIFRQVVNNLEFDYHAGAASYFGTARPASLYQQIEQGNRHFYDVYSRRARMMGLVEMLATYDDEMRAFRLQLRKPFIARLERAITRWQEQGFVDCTLDPRYTANALGSMVDRSVYLWLVLGEPHEPDLAIHTLTQLWTKALGIEPPPCD